MFQISDDDVYQLEGLDRTTSFQTLGFDIFNGHFSTGHFHRSCKIYKVISHEKLK